MNKKLLIVPLIALVFLSALPFTQSQITTAAIDMKGTNWTLKVDANIQTTEILSPIQVTAKSSTEKELSIIINDIKEVPEFTAKFKVDTTGLTLYKQLPLTAELNETEYDLLNATHAIRNGKTVVHRPENVLNSYACFDQTGRKVAHIYGSKLIDAKGDYIWVNQELKDGILTVMLEQKWMESAAYPVTLDPSFGYTTKGATDDNLDTGLTVGTLFTLSENATVTNIKAYINWYETGAATHTAIYNSTGNLLTETANNTKASTGWAEGWMDHTISDYGLIAGDYWLILAGAGNGQPCVSYYDSGGTGIRYAGFTFAATLGEGSVERTYSIYANYTEGLPPTPTPTPTPEPTPTTTAQPATTTTNIFFSLMIFAIICLNLTVGYLSKGFVVPATIGLISISIAVATLFTTVYAEIVFSPWLQLMLLCLAIFNIYQVIRSKS